jgi:hypothetical protein
MSAALQNKSCFVALLILVSFGAVSASAASLDYSAFDPAPVGILGVARPVVAWRIVPRNGVRVTRVQLLLNDTVVPAAYDVARQAVWYTPETALRPGVYDVRCRVTLNNDFRIARDWQFSIAPGAIDAVAAPTAGELRLCDAVNALRRDLHLPTLTMDPRLCAAAGGHSGYLATNHQIAHLQDARLPGFTAAGSGERANAFGFAGDCYEAVSQGSTGSDAVRRLFDAPYHRAPFLQPGAFEVGAGLRDDTVTLLFGETPESGIVTYPVDGQRNVPTRWNGGESPDPLRMHRTAGSRGATGYVITLFSFGPDDARLSVSEATLTGPDSRATPVYVNTPDNDSCLQNGVLIIPQQPLRPGSIYLVSVRAKDGNGQDCSRIWSFTTAPAAGTVLAARH